MKFDGLTPAFRKALRVVDPFAGLIDEPCPGVFVFDALTPAFCERLLSETEKHKSVAPNSMNKYGVVLKDVGLGAACMDLLLELVNPLAQRFYPRFYSRGAALSRCHGFIVNYDPKKQASLEEHYDDSAVTLNVCLGRKFTGGKLLFRSDAGKILAKLDHRVGQAVLHLGSHLHQAQNVRTGTRSNLILWCSR